MPSFYIMPVIYLSDQESNNDYELALCECDRKAAVCFLENRKTYSDRLYDINVEKYCKFIVIMLRGIYMIRPLQSGSSYF